MYSWTHGTLPKGSTAEGVTFGIRERKVAKEQNAANHECDVEEPINQVKPITLGLSSIVSLLLSILFRSFFFLVRAKAAVSPKLLLCMRARALEQDKAKSTTSRVFWWAHKRERLQHPSIHQKRIHGNPGTPR